MKMKSWLNNSIILGNKYDELEFTIQSKKLEFNIIPFFGKGFFHPELGIKLIFTWWKDEEEIAIYINLILVKLCFQYYPTGK